MAASSGNQLARSIRQKVEELKRACQGLDDATASRAPEGRWSPKQILSHLSGPEGSGHLPMFQAFLRDTPIVDIHPGDPFFTERRSRMSVSQLLSEAERNYEGIAGFVENLSGEELDRRAHVPKLKDAPTGEYPTLESMLNGVGVFHLQFHIDHLRQVLQELHVKK